MFAGLALFEVLAYAVDRGQAVGVSLRHLLVKRSGGFAVVLAALRVAEDHVFATQRRDHRSGDLARIGAFGLRGTVLCPEGDVRTLECFGDLRKVREGGAHDEVDARAHLAAAGYDVFGQFYTFGGKRIHLPVAGNNFLSHFLRFLLLKSELSRYSSHHLLTSSIEGAFRPSLFFLLKPHRSLKNLPGASFFSASTVM